MILILKIELCIVKSIKITIFHTLIKIMNRSYINKLLKNNRIGTVIKLIHNSRFIWSVDDYEFLFKKCFYISRPKLFPIFHLLLNDNMRIFKIRTTNISSKYCFYDNIDMMKLMIQKNLHKKYYRWNELIESIPCFKLFYSSEYLKYTNIISHNTVGTSFMNEYAYSHRILSLMTNWNMHKYYNERIKTSYVYGNYNQFMFLMSDKFQEFYPKITPHLKYINKKFKVEMEYYNVIKLLFSESIKRRYATTDNEFENSIQNVFNFAITHACDYNRVKMLKYLLSNDILTRYKNLRLTNKSMYGAFKYNSLDVIEFIFSDYVSKYHNEHNIILNRGFLICCQYNNLDCIKYLLSDDIIKRYGRISKIFLNACFRHAYYNGCIDVIKYFMSYEAQYVYPEIIIDIKHINTHSKLNDENKYINNINCELYDVSFYDNNIDTIDYCCNPRYVNMHKKLNPIYEINIETKGEYKTKRIISKIFSDEIQERYEKSCINVTHIK